MFGPFNSGDNYKYYYYAVQN